MASKHGYLALEAIRHFKEGQIASWTGDEQLASREFDKCQRAVHRFKKEANLSELDSLVESAEKTRRKKDERIEKVLQARISTHRGKLVRMTYTIIPQGSNRAEFRARIDFPWHVLWKLAHRSKGDEAARQVINDRTWQWIETDKDKGFTALILLTYSDGTIYAQVATHYFLDDVTINSLREHIAGLLVGRLTKV